MMISKADCKKRMMCEWDRHDGIIMIWPDRPGTWGRVSDELLEDFLNIYSKIAESEVLLLAVRPGTKDRVRDYMTFHGMDMSNIRIEEIDYDDSWARDISPMILIGDDGRKSAAVFGFNAWGGSYNGLYQDFDKDADFAEKISGLLSLDTEIIRRPDGSPFILEGGSIHTDGQGTLMTTEACLLSPGRNPGMNKQEIEETLLSATGCEKMLWLPRGLIDDETDEHVDNVCTFARPGEVILAFTDNRNDSQYSLTEETYNYLLNERDARGRKLKIYKLPLPDPIYVTKEEADSIEAAPGEQPRLPGERLAASYVNFCRTNKSVLVPQFGGENEEKDHKAIEILGRIFPDKEIYPVNAGRFLLGGGNIHCLTHEY